MAAPRVQDESVAIVLLGSFNPSIFEPLWLSNNGLVSEPEAEGAERQLIDHEFARVVLPWAEMFVDKERLQAQTRSAAVNAAQVRDLVLGVLRLLIHTPVSLLSIHHRTDLEVETEQQWHDAGHRLAPKEPWDGILDDPGMFDFAMAGRRPDDLGGSIRVRVRPLATKKPWGIFMNVNDEVHLLDPPADEPAAHAAELLERIWPEAEQRATRIRTSLIERLF